MGFGNQQNILIFNMNTIKRPEQGNYQPYFDHYIKLVKSDDIFEELSQAYVETMELVTSLDAETLHYRYAEGKWNILEIMQHIIDTERIFNYRALRIARADKTVLAGFDENAFAAHSFAAERDINDIVREFSIVRASTIELFKSFSPDALDYLGTSNNHIVSPRAILFIILGHELHHRNIIQQRYLD
jgi:uncharacterized damage-inducible protein DinB